MDSAFETAPYSGYTTDQLRQMVSKPSANAAKMWAEIDRREAVANGDTSVMTAGERLNHAATKFARKCDECGKGMNEGYVIDGGCEHYCSDACLHKHMSADEYDALHDDGDGDSYWTEWEDESEWDNEEEGE